MEHRTVCMTLAFAAEVRPLSSLSIEELEELHARWLAANSASGAPMPVCCGCDMPFLPKDGHYLIGGTCETCGGQVLEDLTLAFIYAKGRREKKATARRLRRLAK